MSTQFVWFTVAVADTIAIHIIINSCQYRCGDECEIEIRDELYRTQTQCPMFAFGRWQENRTQSHDDTKWNEMHIVGKGWKERENNAYFHISIPISVYTAKNVNKLAHTAHYSQSVGTCTMHAIGEKNCENENSSEQTDKRSNTQTAPISWDCITDRYWCNCIRAYTHRSQLTATRTLAYTRTPRRQVTRQ